MSHPTAYHGCMRARTRFSRSRTLCDLNDSTVVVLSRISRVCATSRELVKNAKKADLRECKDKLQQTGSAHGRTLTVR